MISCDFPAAYIDWVSRPVILRGILVTMGFFHLGVLNMSPVFILGFSSTLGMTLR